ncbi:MAG: 3-hydroxyacyl-CoA dehydrogenase NAD-binding domain-containing protein, partial [Acidobacteria bacterium]|nr:3-hydroxyacyl-CoA dehydrogenase NAD-binding domain-containing protein [Acidobacteriota bacterium]
MAKKHNHNHLSPHDVPAGVIGLGLMGHSIIACLLSAGHPVIAVTRKLSEHRDSRRRVRQLLVQLRQEGLTVSEPAALMERLRLSERYEDLSNCGVVVESVLEDLETKREAYRRVEAVVPARCIIGSNTSSIPVTILQAGATRPERFVGIHWDEPAHVTRFMEIIAGEKTAPRYIKRLMTLAGAWGKEPSL